MRKTIKSANNETRMLFTNDIYVKAAPLKKLLKKFLKDGCPVAGSKLRFFAETKGGLPEQCEDGSIMVLLNGKFCFGEFNMSEEIKTDKQLLSSLRKLIEYVEHPDCNPELAMEA